MIYFQPLTDEDKQIYTKPEIIEISPPSTAEEISILKRDNWIEWRAASYPAKRHSEYLFLHDDNPENTKILISAVMDLPENLEEYIKGDESMNSRKRYNRKRKIEAKKSINKGYSFQRINPGLHSKGIWEIIHSSKERQGRAIVDKFFDRDPDYEFPEYKNFSDPNYQDICTGVFDINNILVAYLLGKRVGDHVQYDEIMGHNNHLVNDIMYLLHLGFIKHCLGAEIPPRFLNYGAWYSGLEPFSSKSGLNKWRRKVGFRPAYLKLSENF